MLRAPKHPLAPGDRIPNFALPGADGKFTMFYERATGRPTVLLVAGDPPTAAEAFEGRADAFERAGVDVFCITLGSALDQGYVRGWSDPKGKVAEALTAQTGLGGPGVIAGEAAAALLLDGNQRLLAAFVGDGEALATEALALYGKRRPEPPAQVQRQTAPVLTMPDLLDPAMCHDLIAMYEAGAVEEGAVLSVIDGEQVSRVHHARKKRLDHKIMDPEINKALVQTLGRRVAPELAKAFNFESFRFDRFLVCRYAADREDRFRAHRDNLSPGTADRRFAMTLNLNGDEYEGGELIFPEYGPDRYKPGNGGAVIFSCSLLHEALPVSEGVRYALLTFMRAPLAQKAKR